jgi:hypothetical protein
MQVERECESNFLVVLDLQSLVVHCSSQADEHISERPTLVVLEFAFLEVGRCIAIPLARFVRRELFFFAGARNTVKAGQLVGMPPRRHGLTATLQAQVKTGQYLLRGRALGQFDCIKCVALGAFRELAEVLSSAELAESATISCQQCLSVRWEGDDNLGESIHPEDLLTSK